ncbi:hypothetical protein WAB17_08325 [Parerythrobacter aurantius]
MSSQSYRSSRPDNWTCPRPYSDASLRYMAYGPVQPMGQVGWISRLLRMD